MELKAHFRARWGVRAIDLPSKQLGLDAVDKARKKTGFRLPLDIVEGYVREVWDNHEAPIPEELARQSGHFGETSRREVIVPENFLNQFVRIEHNLIQDSETGAVKKVSFRYDIDGTAVLEAWEDAGFPLKWGTEEEEE